MASSQGNTQALAMASAGRPGAQPGMASSASAPAVTVTDASVEAWKSHVNALSDSDRNMFLSHQEGDLNGYISKLRFHAEQQAGNSNLLKITKHLQPIFDTGQMYMGAIGTATQAHPNPSTLILGGVMCIAQINTNITSFHENAARDLLNMFRKAEVLLQVDKHLYQNDQPVRSALVEVYGDILQYCEELSGLLINSKGETRSMGKTALKSLVQNYQGKFRSILEKYNDDIDCLKAWAEFSINKRNERFQEQTLEGISMANQGIRSVHDEVLLVGDGTRAIEDEVLSPYHGVRKIHDELSSVQQGVRATKDEVSSMGQNVRMIRGDVSSVDQGVRAVKGEVSILNRGIQTIQDRSMIELSASFRADRRKKRRDILQWLPPISFVEEHERKRKERLEGTGQWLLDHKHYKDWKARDVPDLLHITGKAGCGKSFLANSVIEDLEDERGPNGAVAYMYCAALNVSDHDSAKALGSILKQLCQMTPRIDPTLYSIYDRAGETQNGPTWKQVQDSMRSITSAFSEVYIVVDGLDEHNERGLISEFLRILVSNATGIIKVIVFSRPNYVEIEKEFERYSALVVDSDKNKEDMERYITALLTDEKFPIPKDSHRIGEIRERVLEKADGMFLYVSLLMKALMDQRNTKQVMNIVDALPDELKNVYDLSMERITRESKSKQETAFRILFWTANAKRALTRAEMVEAISVEPGMAKLEDDDLTQNERDFTSLCADLVFVDNDECYRLIHTTLQEYLLKLGENRPLELKSYYEKQMNAGRILGEICLTYLLFETFRTYDYVSTEALESLKGANALFEYAATFWGQHIEQVAEEALHDRVVELLDCPKSFQISMQILLQYHGYDLCDQPQTITNCHSLALFGLVRIAKRFFSPSLSPFTADDRGRLPFDYAVLGNQEQSALWLAELGERQVQEGGEEKVRSGQYERLHVAAVLNWPRVIKALIAQGHDVDTPSRAQELTALIAASDQGSELAVKELLAAKANIHAKAKDGSTALMLAAHQNHQSIVKALLENGAEVTDMDKDGATALHSAAEKGNKEIAILLLEKDADPRKKMTGLSQETPLHLTGRSDAVEIAKLLKPEAQDLEARTLEKYTPLHYASFFDSIGVVRYLIECGAEVDPKDDDLSTPLHIAADFKGVRILPFLVETGKACIDSINKAGDTPLHLAARAGNLDAVSFLLRHNAKSDIRNSLDSTPLHNAVTNGDKDLVKLFFDYEADAMIGGIDESPVLHYAAQYGHKQLIEVIIEAKADPTATDKFGNTALHFAARQGQVEFLEKLYEVVPIELLDKVNDFGQTPLHRAATNGHISTVRFLLDKRAKSLPSEDGNLPIHLAALNGHEAVVSDLITAESVEATGFYKRTALHCAALQGHLQVVELLLRHDSNVNALDDGGGTPAISAIAGRHLDVVNLLVNSHTDVKITSHRDGFALLQGAAEMGDVDLVRKLLKSGCDGLQKMTSGHTPFLAAAGSGKVRLLELFLDENFDGSRDKTEIGITAVHAAAEQGDFATLEKLLALGADLHAVGYGGLNAVSFAAAAGRHEMIDHLAEKGVNLEGSLLTGNTPLQMAAKSGKFQVVDRLLHHGVNVFTKIRESGVTALQLAAARGCVLTVDKLLAYRADPLSRDAYGLNSLDYASRYPLCFRRFGNLADSYQPFAPAERRGMLRNTIISRVRSALRPPALELVEYQGHRVMLMLVLAYSLIYIEDHPDHERAKLCFGEICFPPDTDLIQRLFSCDMCNRVLRKENIFICRECFETCFCDRCYGLYLTGFKTPKSLPELFLNIEDIEREVYPVKLLTMKALKDEPSSSWHIMRFMLMIEEWVYDMHRRYEEWHKKHNSDGEFKTYPQDNFKFVKLTKSLLNVMFSEASLRTQRTPDFDKIIAELLEINTSESEFREVVCSNHDFVSISWDEWEKTKADSNSAVTQGGKVKDSYLEELLRNYEAVASGNSSEEPPKSLHTTGESSTVDEVLDATSTDQPDLKVSATKTNSEPAKPEESAQSSKLYGLQSDSSTGDDDKTKVLGNEYTSETDGPIFKFATHVTDLYKGSDEKYDGVFFFLLRELGQSYYASDRLIEAEALQTLELESWISKNGNKADRDGVPKYRRLIVTKIKLQKPLEALRLVDGALYHLIDGAIDDDSEFEDILELASSICQGQKLVEHTKELQELLVRVYRSKANDSEVWYNNLITSISDLAKTKNELGDIEGAKALFQETLAFLVTADDQYSALDEPQLSFLFVELGNQKLYPEAEEIGDQLLQKRLVSAVDGESNARLRLTLRNLALVKLRLGKMEKARSLAVDAWKNLRLHGEKSRKSTGPIETSAEQDNQTEGNEEDDPEYSDECVKELEDIMILLADIYCQADELEATEELQAAVLKYTLKREMGNPSEQWSSPGELLERLTALATTKAKIGKVDEARVLCDQAASLLKEEVREEQRQFMEVQIHRFADAYMSKVTSALTRPITESEVPNDDVGVLTEEPLDIRDEHSALKTEAKVFLSIHPPPLLKSTLYDFLSYGYFHNPASTKRILRIQGLLKASFSESMDNYLDRPIRKFSDGVD